MIRGGLIFLIVIRLRFVHRSRKYDLFSQSSRMFHEAYPFILSLSNLWNLTSLTLLTLDDLSSPEMQFSTRLKIRIVGAKLKNVFIIYTKQDDYFLRNKNTWESFNQQTIYNVLIF